MRESCFSASYNFITIGYNVVIIMRISSRRFFIENDSCYLKYKMVIVLENFVHGLLSLSAICRVTDANMHLIDFHFLNKLIRKEQAIFSKTCSKL